MGRVTQEGTDVKIQFATQGKYAVPLPIGEHKFTVKGQIATVVAWDSGMYATVKEKLKEKIEEVNKDPAHLSELGKAWRDFILETGGRAEADGALKEPGDRAYMLSVFSFKRHGWTIGAVIPYPLDKITWQDVQGFTKKDVMQVRGIWVPKPLWHDVVKPSKAEAAERIRKVLPTGHVPTQAEIDEEYQKLPPAKYVWYFFLPEYYEGESVDVVAALERAGSVMQVMFTTVKESSKELAEYPVIKSALENTNRLRDDDRRQLEQMQAALMTTRREYQMLAQRYGEKAKPIHMPQPVATRPEFGTIPYDQSEQAFGASLGKGRHLPSVRPFILPIVAIIGVIVAAYFGTATAPPNIPQQAQAAFAQQEGIYTAFGVMLAIGAGLGWVISRMRRRGKPTPQQVTQATVPPVAPKVP